jgi:hypothetical protein
VVRTLRYYFEALAIGIYVRVRQGRVVEYRHLTNLRFRNDWGIDLDVREYKRRKQRVARYAERFDFDTARWTANNCLLGSLLPRAYSERRMHHFRDMLEETAASHRLPDCDFMLNRRDFPTMTNDGTHPYLDVVRDQASSPFPGPMIPVLGTCTSPRHADLAIPNEDDWELATRRVLPPDCRALYDDTLRPVPWASKRDVAVWRGKATGCGVTVDTNQRLHLYQLSRRHPDHVDAGVTGWNLREKMSGGQVRFLDPRRLPPDIRRKAPRLTHQEQLRYKYHVNVDGHVAAFRLGFLLSVDCVVLQVASPRGYAVWYADQLVPYEHYVPIQADLSDLIQQIDWCRSHDAECRAISTNATALHARLLSKQAICAAWHRTLCRVAAAEHGAEDAADAAGGGGSRKQSKPRSRKQVAKRYRAYKESRVLPAIRTVDVPPPTADSHPVIVVPYREREAHLAELRPWLAEFFGERPYRLVVVEQGGDGKFNRGWLLNVGFVIARDLVPRPTHFVFHDVDSLPGKELRPFYLQRPDDNTVVHLASPTYYGKYSFHAFLGGVTAVTAETHELVNGYPNTFRGWGGEDDSYMNRCAAAGVTVVRPRTGSFRLLDHAPPRPEEVNQRKQEQILQDLRDSASDGLRTLTYQATYDEARDIYRVMDPPPPSPPRRTVQRPPRAGKVAFLFMTIGDVKQAETWRRFFAATGSPHGSPHGSLEGASVYVHAKHRGDVRSFLRDHLIEDEIPTQWGHISLVQVMVALLRNALRDPETTAFVFVSDTCIPVRPLAQVRREVLGTPHSMFHRQGSIARFWSPDVEKRCQQQLAPTVEARHVAKASQWCVLNRPDAETVVRTEETYVPVFAKLDKSPPDEIYMLTVLRQEAAKQGHVFHHQDRMTTYTRWLNDTPAGARVQRLVDRKNAVAADDDATYQTLRRQLLQELRQAKRSGWSSKHPWEFTRFSPSDVRDVLQSEALLLRKVGRDTVVPDALASNADASLPPSRPG